MTRPVQFIEYDEALEHASTLMVATGASLLIVTKQNQRWSDHRARPHVDSSPSGDKNSGRSHSDRARVSWAEQAHNAVVVHLTILELDWSRKRSRSPEPSRPVFLAARAKHTSHGSRESAQQRARTGRLGWPLWKAPGPEIQFMDLSNADSTRLKAWLSKRSLPNSQDQRCFDPVTTSDRISLDSVHHLKT